jgi:uncharacterized protein
VCGLRERALSDVVPIAFDVAGSSRIGVVHLPAGDARHGVLIIVGGWQYRVGSHRQFVLLGRALAAAGIATMRFDSRGMGDSEGESGAPEPAEHLAPDIRAALDVFAECTPGIVDFTLCGLCDGASAALMYAPLDPRVTRLVLLNPWVSNQGGAARTAWRHYYLSRLTDPELWRKLASGRFAMRASLHGLSDRVARGAAPSGPQSAEAVAANEASLRIDRGMTEALDAFAGRILLVLSSRDLTADRYAAVVAGSARWRTLLRLGRAIRIDMLDTDHTFSRRVLRDALAADMERWLPSHARQSRLEQTNDPSL